MARKVLIYVVLAVIAVNLVIVTVVFTGGNAPGARPLPNPNGYDDFVKAGQMVASNHYDYYAINADMLPAHLPQLEALVASNSAALVLLRTGLGRECLQPLEYSPDYYQNKFMSQMASFKLLAYVICTEGNVAWLNNQTDKAADIYLDGVRFSGQFCRGGVMITKLVGVADEHIASRPLAALLPSLSDPAECRKIVSVLETVDAQEEPVSDILEQERIWSRKTHGISGEIETLINFRAERAIEARFISKVQATQLDRSKLMIDFAARAYELEKGKPPQNVTDLVPDYLKAVPKDPVTGKDMGLGR
jgi:hypothetical protein